MRSRPPNRPSGDFFSSADSYDPDRLTFDRELLRRFYLSEGYADFRVISAVAELTPDREGFIITFTLEEGDRYKFGVIDLNTTLKNLDPELLRADLLTEEGEWYDASAVEESVANLTERLNNLGYAFVDIRPQTNRDRENLTIGLVYEINEGPKVYVERINIQGNVRTIDKVIRREFRFVEGDAFNSAKIKRTRSRINDLGFFSSVEITNEPGTEPDKTIVTVDVQEQSTGSLTFGAGFSTNSGPLGNVGIRERNLLGRGQDLRLNFTLGGQLSELELSFTEPYFLDRNLSAGVDAFWTTNEQDESSFDERRLGGSLRAGYDLTENIRQVWRYTLEQVDIDNVDDDASLVVQLDQGKRVESVISHELTYDARDSKFDPRGGYVVTFLNEFAGLGGDVRYSAEHDRSRLLLHNLWRCDDGRARRSRQHLRSRPGHLGQRPLLSWPGPAARFRVRRRFATGRGDRRCSGRQELLYRDGRAQLSRRASRRVSDPRPSVQRCRRGLGYRQRPLVGHRRGLLQPAFCGRRGLFLGFALWTCYRRSRLSDHQGELR